MFIFQPPLTQNSVMTSPRPDATRRRALSVERNQPSAAQHFRLPNGPPDSVRPQSGCAGPRRCRAKRQTVGFLLPASNRTGRPWARAQNPSAPSASRRRSAPDNGSRSTPRACPSRPAACCSPGRAGTADPSPLLIGQIRRIAPSLLLILAIRSRGARVHIPS